MQKIEERTVHQAKAGTRGHKAKLPPRIPSIRRLPRLSKSNFATPAILQALNLTKILNDTDEIDADIFQGIALEQKVHNRIREVVADYCADITQKMAPTEFRSKLREFQRLLERAAHRFPAAHSPLTNAIDQQLDLICDEAPPDQTDLHYVEEVRCALGKLLTATEQLSKTERGAGRDGNRAGHLLIKGLSAIFEEHTKVKAKCAFWIDQIQSGDEAVRGRFADFVKAVNDAIPLAHQIEGLESLFRALD